MKLLIENWRRFLFEQTVKYQGILKLSLPPDVISEVQAMQDTLPKDAVPLEEDDLHVTLIHQSFLKPHKKEIKNMSFPQPPMISLDKKIWEREDLGKKSWAVKLSDENQIQMRDYVQEVMKRLGSDNTDPEPERVFHVSLANLTGNPHDSVR